MGNLADAASIVMFFYFGAVVLDLFGISIFRAAIFTPVGVIVSVLLAFMETTYNRF